MLEDIAKVLTNEEEFKNMDVKNAAAVKNKHNRGQEDKLGVT